ncbi:HAMP domain-containing sensor histidine kinase [Pseudonocardia petroleophila]|uniref:histidine kinase n=1 Tax=Pseudonocardia petroleophila TaxID=37331 RepID=A0A7G7MIG7_9PSEU|nr:HAMP domain-containing sensor histidine kinase [Pseudonocardia petroleophila]QNG52578.1 HAMP domain-containing histidine kinase [Pseudonocardia petroleophila]
MRGTLRARLVATVLLLLAVTGAVIGIVTTVSLHRILVDQLDDNLRAAGGIARGLPPADDDRGVPDGDDLPAGAPLGPGLQFGVLVAVVSDGRVTSAAVLDRRGASQPVPAEATPALLDVRAGDRPRSADLGELGDYRLVAGSRTSSDGSTVTVVTGQSERPLQETLSTLVAIEVVVVAVALLGAGVAGAVAVRRELRPLEQVAATASRVGALPLASGEVELAERVPVADPRSEVGQVGTALNRMLDHVGAALEERHASELQLRQFVADASHELRTPLAAIRGYAELSRRGELTEETAYSLQRISSSAERMSTLVEDLLLLARLDAGRPLERTEVDLTHLVLDAVNDAHVAGPGHRWLLDLPEEPVTVTGDPSRLAQVLGNLLANARTHTPPGTRVSVGLAPVAGGVALTVVDDGPGIAPDLAPRVFERFARGSSSRSRENGSTGLGLAIVSAVVAAHRGTVDVTSRPGRTEFTVTLPR